MLPIQPLLLLMPPQRLLLMLHRRHRISPRLRPMLRPRLQRISPLQGQPPRLWLELRTLPRLGQHLVSQHLIQNHILQVQRQGLSSPRRA